MAMASIVRVGQQSLIIGRGRDRGITGLHQIQPLWVQIADGDHLGVGDFGKISNQIRPPVTIANNADFNHDYYSMLKMEKQFLSESKQILIHYYKARSSLKPPFPWCY